MKNLLKILILGNLLFALLALWFIAAVHDQREILKTQIQEHRSHTQRMAAALQWGQFDKLEAKIRTDGNTALLGEWNSEQASNVARMERALLDYQQMPAALKRMETITLDRVESLVEAKLACDKLDRELESTELQLEDSKAQVVRLQENLELEEQALVDARREIEEREGRIRKLNGEIESQKGAMLVMTEELADKEESILEGKMEVELCRRDYQILWDECNGKTRDNEGRSRAGKVVEVNHAWDFVVVNRGELDEVQKQDIGMIHRDGQLIGQIIIIETSKKVSIGKIAPEFSLSGISIRPSDNVMF